MIQGEAGEAPEWLSWLVVSRWFVGGTWGMDAWHGKQTPLFMGYGAGWIMPD